jgi:alpha-tubulin suppressor-like RCC1 family protein
MLLFKHRSLPFSRRSALSSRFAVLLTGLTLAASLAGCGSDPGDPTDTTVEVASISIDTPSVQLERGSHKVFTATAKNSKGQVVVVPFVWRSSDETVATVDLNGKLTAKDEGVSGVTASSLGVTSPAVGVRVVWQGAAKLATYAWTAPGAATPSAIVGDSIRVAAVTKANAPAAGTTVIFSVAAGGGKLSSTKVTTDANGIAATQWTLGPTNGVNTVTATVVDDEGNAIPWVNPNQTTFSVTTFKALDIVAGNQQSATILSPLPVAPSVRLVDAAGKPRQGVPVTFVATAGGQLAFPVVSTGSDGVASPGVWTLGDIPGDQVVIASVEAATISVHANATGTPIHFLTSQISAGGSATCALSAEGLASCWGLSALVGNGDTLSQTTPTSVKGGISFKSITVGLSHVCAISIDQSLYCWGFNAYADTSGKAIGMLAPMRLATDLKWAQVATGIEHTCAIATDQNAYCWGLNSRGQLGVAVADTITRFVPTPVYGGFKFSSITAGAAHTCALTVDRTAFCWGWNANGQLGDGTLASRVAPTVVSGGLTFQSIGAGEQWTCGLTTLGKAYCWGAVPGVSATQATPQTYPSAPTFSSLSVGGTHACALTPDGTAYCWGGNNAGQVGDSTTINRSVPTKVSGNFKFASITAGDAHTCGRLTDNSVVCWGINRFGELGDAKAAFRLAPRYIVLGVNP